MSDYRDDIDAIQREAAGAEVAERINAAVIGHLKVKHPEQIVNVDADGWHNGKGFRYDYNPMDLSQPAETVCIACGEVLLTVQRVVADGRKSYTFS